MEKKEIFLSVGNGLLILLLTSIIAFVFPALSNSILGAIFVSIIILLAEFLLLNHLTNNKRKLYFYAASYIIFWLGLIIVARIVVPLPIR